MSQPTRILQRDTDELTPEEEDQLRKRLMFPRRSPPLQRQPSDAEPLVISSGSGTQNHHAGTSSAARTSLMKNLNLHTDDHVVPDEYDQQQPSSSSYCPNNMDHKHPHHLLNSSNKLLSHKPSTTSTATFSTAPSRPVASSTSNINMTNPFEDPSHIIETSPSGSSTPSTIASDAPTPQTTNGHKPISASHGPHPLCAIHSNTGLEGNTGLDGTVSAGFTAGTQSGLPIPGVTNKRVHTSTTVSSKRSHRSGRSTSSRLSRRVKKFPRTAKRAVRRFLRRIMRRKRQRKEKTTVTWTAPQV
ncbi:hypothetical protein B0T20DRAFT_452062 [Sordaria brevicollis]|uniref:Uncharacterized protein n=1 Tax=Sordaria brevicollis TaxID=83679 RepID=A0AAE0PHC3_SORBR|nr:hypothetical protein B0T20DRAFT_452062 [Sordaria brevicollis]